MTLNGVMTPDARFSAVA